VCTVVVRWVPEAPVLVLALRDELVGREFDDPGAWWPEQPRVHGGRDRVAGGSWCVTDVATGATALVLNRPQRREAAAGAASRGVLPLLACAHGRDWPSQVELAGMASFALVIAGPDGLTQWVFDGQELTTTVLPAGTHMVTSGGAEDGKADRYLTEFAADASPEAWRRLVVGRQPTDDPAALLVRHALPDAVYATVFGQVIEAQPGSVKLAWSRTPWVPDSWTTQLLS
jgi:uncharacterized protein with NRDE domain